MFGASKDIKHRLQKLEMHLQNESPLLVEAVKGFRDLDRVAYRLGLLDRDQSYTTQIPWWPLISILGTYSAGKSTFINSYVGESLQETGNQAVDDKFTVVSFANGGESRTLPGIALDADPRFPFYQIADELDKVAPGDGAHVNAYLQLKTSPSEKLRGYIFIDSPGFDADEQRNSTLKITDYIIDLSDLVLVFFDARHPEAGTMRDTLEHLVSGTISRKDSNKFIYILNQMDATAREDNPEDVVAAWQKALSQEGLTAGRFFTIYNQQAVDDTNDNGTVENRLERKCRDDLDEINERIKQVHVDRIYRILGNLDKTAREIEQRIVPKVRGLVSKWVRGVVWRDVAAFSVLIGALLAGLVAGGIFKGADGYAPWLSNVIQAMQSNIWVSIGAGLGLFIIMYLIHHGMRILSLRSVVRDLEQDYSEDDQGILKRALIRNTRFLRSIFRPDIVGWHRFTRNRLHSILEQADEGIQKLNDQYTRPSGQTAD